MLKEELCQKVDPDGSIWSCCPRACGKLMYNVQCLQVPENTGLLSHERTVCASLCSFYDVCSTKLFVLLISLLWFLMHNIQDCTDGNACLADTSDLLTV